MATRGLIAAALLAAFISAPAHALELIDKLEACAALVPDDKRLQCYDRIARKEGYLADIGGTTVSIPPPGGWCRLEPEKLSDARLAGILSESMERIGNTFIVAYVDCGELERWRSGQQRTLDNYGSVAYGNGFREFEYPGSDASFVAEMRGIVETAGQDYIEDLLERTREVAEDVMPTVKLGEPMHLGIIGEDESSLYLGGLMSIVTEFGDPKVFVYSNGATLLRRKIVYTHLYTGFDDAQVIPRLLNDHKKWTARLRAAN